MQTRASAELAGPNVRGLNYYVSNVDGWIVRKLVGLLSSRSGSRRRQHVTLWLKKGTIHVVKLSE